MFIVILFFKYNISVQQYVDKTILDNRTSNLSTTNQTGQQTAKELDVKCKKYVDDLNDEIEKAIV